MNGNAWPLGGSASQAFRRCETTADAAALRHERAALAGAMLAGCRCRGLVRVPGLAGVLVVTGEPRAAAMAQAAARSCWTTRKRRDERSCRPRRRVVSPMSDGGHARDSGRRAARSRPRTSRRSCLRIVPHRRSRWYLPASDGGTNALACSPPLAVPCSFRRGQLARAPERGAGRRHRGDGCCRLERDRACDIDRPDDLAGSCCARRRREATPIWSRAASRNGCWRIARRSMRGIPRRADAAMNEGMLQPMTRFPV